MRLSLACGRHDWRAVWDELTPEEWDEWVAFDELDGIANQKLEHIMAIGFSIISRQLGSELEWWQFIPHQEKPSERKVGPGEAASMFGKMVKR